MVVLFGALVFGRVRFSEWEWPYNLYRIWTYKDLLFILAGFAYVYCGWRWSTSKKRGSLLWFIVLLLLFSLATLSLPDAGYRNLAASYYLLNYQSAVLKDVINIPSSWALIDGYGDWFTYLSEIGKTHPPGVVILFRPIYSLTQIHPGATQAFIDLTEWAGVSRPASMTDDEWAIALCWTYFSPLFTLTATAPLYFVAKSLYGQKEARIAAVLFALTPAIIVFHSSLMPLLTMMATWSLGFMVLARRRKVKAWMVLSGLIAGLTVFIHYVMAFWVLALMCFYGLGKMDTGGWRALIEQRREIFSDIALFGTGAIVPWAPLILNPNYHLLAFFKQAIQFHHHVTETRNAALWVLMNPFATLLYQNPAIVFFFLISLVRGVKIITGREQGKQTPLSGPRPSSWSRSICPWSPPAKPSGYGCSSRPCSSFRPQREISRMQERQGLYAKILALACLAIIVIGVDWK